MYQKLALQAGQAAEFVEQADFFRVMKMSQADLTVIFYRMGAEIARAENVGSGFAERAPEGFDKLRLVSAVGGTLEYVTRIGHEVRYDTPPNGAVVITQGSLVSQSAITVGVAAAPLAAVNGDRKSLRVFNNGAADVYLGGAGVTTANGAVRLKSGDTWVEDDGAAAAWYGISGTAGQDVRVQEIV